jgi:integrase
MGVLPLEVRGGSARSQPPPLVTKDGLYVEREKPKTKKSKRQVDLPDVAIDILNALPRTTDHVFPNVKLYQLTRAFRTAVRKSLGVSGFTFHSTRSFSVTADAEMGVPEKFTQARVGHTNPAQTQHYMRIRSAKLAEINALRDSTLKQMLPILQPDT